MIPFSPTEALPFQTDDDGIVRIGRTRVTLDVVITAFTEGATAEEIAQQYPSLQLADIYSVIGYYLRHRSEADAYLRQRTEQAAKVRKKNESRSDPIGIRDRLLSRRAGPHH
jgi:uncharacterized protein (DUF433 family)